MAGGHLSVKSEKERTVSILPLGHCFLPELSKAIFTAFFPVPLSKKSGQHCAKGEMTHSECGSQMGPLRNTGTHKKRYLTQHVCGTLAQESVDDDVLGFVAVV